MIDSWTNIRGIRVAQQLSFSNKSVADGGFLEKNLQEGFMGAGEKKKKKLEATPRLMGGRWKRGFLSSCFHHPSACGCSERGRIIAAGLNLQDLFSLTTTSLTINLNLPRREEFLHICVLAGGGRNGVAMHCVIWERCWKKDGAFESG